MDKDLERNMAASVSGAGATAGAACAAQASPEWEEAEALDFIARMIDKGELDPVDGIDLCYSKKG